MKILLGGHKIRVKFEKFKGSNKCKLGIYRHDAKTVLINKKRWKKLPKSGKVELLVHELFHVINDRLNLGMSEKIINIIGEEWCAILLNNKSFIRGLLNGKGM